VKALQQLAVCSAQVFEAVGVLHVDINCLHNKDSQNWFTILDRPGTALGERRAGMQLDLILSYTSLFIVQHLWKWIAWFPSV
jgi:hypothetical protein